jgi:hypothetical protein
MSLSAYPIVSTRTGCAPGLLHCYKSHRRSAGKKEAPAGGGRGFDGSPIRNQIVAPYRLVDGLSKTGEIVGLGIQFLRQYTKALSDDMGRIIRNAPGLHRGHPQEGDRQLFGP